MGQCGLLIYCSIARVPRRAFYIFRALEQWTIEHESIEPMRSTVPLLYCSCLAVPGHFVFRALEHWTMEQWANASMRSTDPLLNCSFPFV
jgi:hypothetical protein